MQTLVSTKGRVVVPARIRHGLGVRPGDQFEISIEEDRIVLTPSQKPNNEGRIIEDPITGLPVLDLGPDAPTLSSEMVRELLVDFP